MTFFRKTSPKSIGFWWIRWYDEHLLKYVSLVFWTSIFVGLKVPFVSFVWGTFKDMYLHTTLLHYLLPIDADDDDNEWMNEMKEVCNINTPLNQQFPKRFPLPTEKKTSLSKQQIRQNIGPPNVVTYGAVLAACDWGRLGKTGFFNGYGFSISVRGPLPIC